MRPYKYRCNDNSLLTPAFKRVIITPLIKFVPWAIPANIITFVSNGIVYLSLYLALNPEIFGQATPLLVAAGLILYLIGDHLDGMQAKRTGTGSALGEFCDHYLDAFNNGVVMFTMIVVFGIVHKPVVAGVMVISYWAHMAVFYEQFKTGWLTFEPVGSLEGVLLSSLLIALSAINPVDELFRYPLFADYSIIETTLIISSLGAVVTFYKTWKRTPDVRPGFWIFTFLSAAVGVLGIQFFSSFELFIVITLYCSLYIGRVMHGHLIDGVERTTDLVTPLLMLVLYIPSFIYKDYLFNVVVAYLSISIAVLIFRTFSVLKIYWVWLNLRT
ncbi:MAG TPA: CDP-alcohol phosphatidyltransferase family protein [Chryseolinea sp.]